MELSNPLGSAKGRHKLIQMFWTVLDLSSQYQSKIDTINLTIIVKENLVRKYGYAKIYQPLIDDLKTLEAEGVLVSYPFRRTIKASVLVHIGDNLEQHSLGGFSRSFSSKDIVSTATQNNIFMTLANMVHMTIGHPQNMTPSLQS